MERDEGGRKPAPHHSPVLYCFCRKPESGYMLQCELCNEWYHASCLHIPKGRRTAGRDLGKETRFLCGLCLRTRRPRLDAIVSLLISLQKVPVAISEGTALHCLAERAISWQKRARQEITSCNALLEAAKQQMRRVQEVKAHIAKWKAEMQLTAEERERPTCIEAQLASSAGGLICLLCVCVYVYHSYTHSHTHTIRYTQTLTHTHSHAHTRTHTHTRTHQVLFWPTMMLSCRDSAQSTQVSRAARGTLSNTSSWRETFSR